MNPLSSSDVKSSNWMAWAEELHMGEAFASFVLLFVVIFSGVLHYRLSECRRVLTDNPSEPWQD